MKKNTALILALALSGAAALSLTAFAEEKGEGVMTYEEYLAAETDTEVVVEAYVQAKQSWWDNTATVYCQDEDGGYFLYGMACSEEDYEKLAEGQKIKVTGYKSEWSGEVEIVDATFELEDGNYVAEAVDATALLGTDELIDKMNQKVAFKGMTVEASEDADGKEAAFLYNYDGSGQEGDDLYFNVSCEGETYTFTVESYLCDESSDVYKAVKELKVGDVIDMEGFLYWYEGPNPHITSVKAAEAGEAAEEAEAEEAEAEEAEEAEETEAEAAEETEAEAAEETEAEAAEETEA